MTAGKRRMVEANPPRTVGERSTCTTRRAHPRASTLFRQGCLENVTHHHDMLRRGLVSYSALFMVRIRPRRNPHVVIDDVGALHVRATEAS